MRARGDLHRFAGIELEHPADQRDGAGVGRVPVCQPRPRGEAEPGSVLVLEEQATVQGPLQRRGVEIAGRGGQQANRAKDLRPEAQALLQERQIGRQPIRQLRADRELVQRGRGPDRGAGVEHDGDLLEIELGRKADVAPGAESTGERALVPRRQKERGAGAEREEPGLGPSQQDAAIDAHVRGRARRELDRLIDAGSGVVGGRAALVHRDWQADLERPAPRELHPRGEVRGELGRHRRPAQRTGLLARVDEVIGAQRVEGVAEPELPKEARGPDLRAPDGDPVFGRAGDLEAVEVTRGRLRLGPSRREEQRRRDRGRQEPQHGPIRYPLMTCQDAGRVVGTPMMLPDFTPLGVAPVRFAEVRVVLLSFALVRFVPVRFALARFMLVRTAPVRFALGPIK